MTVFLGVRSTLFVGLLSTMLDVSCAHATEVRLALISHVPETAFEAEVPDSIDLLDGISSSICIFDIEEVNSNYITNLIGPIDGSGEFFTDSIVFQLSDGHGRKISVNSGGQVRGWQGDIKVIRNTLLEHLSGYLLGISSVVGCR